MELQLDEGGEHGAKQVMGRVGPVVTSGAKVAGFNAGINVYGIDNSLKHTINLTLEIEKKVNL